jgi:hypothetical protein
LIDGQARLSLAQFHPTRTIRANDHRTPLNRRHLSQEKKVAEEKLTGSITVNSACITTFSFETNGYQGGDGGHGGFLQVTIDGHGSTMMNVARDNEPMQMSASGDTNNKIAIRFFGDCEMANAAEGLEFLAARIRQALNPAQIG